MCRTANKPSDLCLGCASYGGEEVDGAWVTMIECCIIYSWGWGMDEMDVDT